MSIVITLLTIVMVFVCLLIILLVLMQRPKQEGLGSAFGGGMTDQMFGAQTSNVLQKGTVWLAIAFFAISIALAVLMSKNNRQDEGLGENLLNAPAPVPEKAPLQLPESLRPTGETDADAAAALGLTPPAEKPMPEPAEPKASETTPGPPEPKAPAPAEEKKKPTPEKKAEPKPQPEEGSAGRPDRQPAAEENPAAPADKPAAKKDLVPEAPNAPSAPDAPGAPAPPSAPEAPDAPKTGN